MADYVCNMCAKDGREPFSAPADPIGAALMRAHLDEAHQVGSITETNPTGGDSRG